MNDLISRSALLQAMENKYAYEVENGFYETGFASGFVSCEEVVKNAPTIEAVPVVHAEWILGLDEYDVEFAECSACKEVFYDGENDTFDIHPNFCPNCGAKMD